MRRLRARLMPSKRPEQIATKNWETILPNLITDHQRISRMEETLARKNTRIRDIVPEALQRQIKKKQLVGFNFIRRYVKALKVQIKAGHQVPKEITVFIRLGNKIKTGVEIKASSSSTPTHEASEIERAQFIERFKSLGFLRIESVERKTKVNSVSVGVQNFRGNAILLGHEDVVRLTRFGEFLLEELKKIGLNGMNNVRGK